MPFEVKWLVDSSVTYTRMWGETTPEEFGVCMRQVAAMMDTSSRKLVHQIFDSRETTKLPSLREIYAVMPKPAHPQTGWVISVSEMDMLRRFLSDVLPQMIGARRRTFKTLEEAVDFLKGIDKSIDWPPTTNAEVA
jgi:hypothetical protein